MAKPPVQPTEAENPHLIGYWRVSTADQNPQLQIDALVAAGVDPRDIYGEKISGGIASLKKRREFRHMMLDASQGDIVVVWKLDRLGRSLKQILDTVAELDRRGARLRVLTQPIDTSTPWGRMIMHVLGAVAEVERELAKERSRAGLAAARARGRVGGRKPQHTLAQLEEAAELGTRPGARHLGMTVAGFVKALERERARAAVAEGASA